MEQNNLVSVIIPVYNSEKYIERCIKSILNQTYKNIEVIVINDGSQDSSEKIIHELAKKDSRIVVINKENEGVSRTRTTGIKNIKGNYVCFVDSDDFIAETMIEKLYESITKNKSQLSVCGYYDFYADKDTKIVSFYDKDELLCREPYMMNLSTRLHSIYYGVLWNKMYVADIIRGQQIEFREGISLGEDVIFNLDYLSCIDTISVIRDPLYYYNHDNEQSLTNNKDPWYQWLMGRERYTYYIKKYKDLGVYEKCKKELNNALSVELVGPIYEIIENHEYKMQQAINKLKELFSEQIIVDALYGSNINTKVHKIARICVKKKKYTVFYILMKLQAQLKKIHMKEH